MGTLSKPRVVLDSNIYISAFLFGGKPLQVVQLAERGAFILLISASVRSEVEDTLAEKFGYSSAMIHNSCNRIWTLATQIVPAIRVDLCRDEDDNRILECALAGDARFIVTGDRDLLDLPHVSRYTILRADAFLQIMQGER